MSSKNDRDNRSNQLNSNNSAYHSSRAGSARDDYEDEGYHQPYVDIRSYKPVSIPVHQSGQYGVGIVTSGGEARFFTFQLQANGERSIFCNESILQVRLEDYFERFTQYLFSMVIRHYKARPALFVLFDGTSSKLPWHVPLDLNKPELMRQFILDEKPQVEKGFDPGDARALLCSVLQEPYEDWGSFEAERQQASTLSFSYAKRCAEALGASQI